MNTFVFLRPSSWQLHLPDHLMRTQNRTHCVTTLLPTTGGRAQGGTACTANQALPAAPSSQLHPSSLPSQVHQKVNTAPKASEKTDSFIPNIEHFIGLSIFSIENDMLDTTH